MKPKKQKAFTLMELLAVVIIVGVTAAFAIPRLNIAVERNIASEGISILTAIRDSQSRFYTSRFHATASACTYALDWGEMDIPEPISTNFPPPVGLHSSCNVNGGNIVGTVARSTSEYSLELFAAPNGTFQIFCNDGGVANSWCEKFGIPEN